VGVKLNVENTGGEPTVGSALYKPLIDPVAKLGICDALATLEIL